MNILWDVITYLLCRNSNIQGVKELFEEDANTLFIISQENKSTAGSKEKVDSNFN